MNNNIKPKNQLSAYLEKYNVCAESYNWFKYKTMQEAWQTCRSYF